MRGEMMPDVLKVMAKPEVTDVQTPERARRGPRGQVIIFGTWCKGCGLCVAFCPVQVLALDAEGYPIVVAPEKCTACHWCDTHCPDLAIVVKRIEGG
jgi:NAD-dependent dihydropyrimidine dehydrogenase PreA subunit